MQQDIEQLVNSTLETLSSIQDTEQLYQYKVTVLGKSGRLTQLLRSLKDMPSERRVELGQLANIAKAQLEESFKVRHNELYSCQIDRQLKADRLDISIDIPLSTRGNRHPISIVRNKIVEFFVQLDYTLIDSPEIETEYYNFEALNIPSDHPARDMQDTFFVSHNLLLRSHTSNGQIRAMESIKPPFRILSPGRVYRADDADATHSPVFHQVEGLVVDKALSMRDLKFVLDSFVRHIFGANATTRLRPSYFPFTEPSVEVDASCSCDNGCNVCKHTGWIEILGAGMVNPKVFLNCNIEGYTGFAFGMGIERITNIMYRIPDMRILFENDIRMLRQFG